MKTAIKSALILFVVVLFSACAKEGHTIRLKNEFSEQLNNVKVGSADIGSVPSGKTSEYKPINTGNFTISGTTTSGQSLSGSGTISGRGKHRWTMTLNSSGTVSLSEDE